MALFDSLANFITITDVPKVAAPHWTWRLLTPWNFCRDDRSATIYFDKEASTVVDAMFNVDRAILDWIPPVDDIKVADGDAEEMEAKLEVAKQAAVSKLEAVLLPTGGAE